MQKQSSREDKPMSLTNGEMKIQSLFSRLPESEFAYSIQPRIDNDFQNSRYPDAILIIRSKGILAIEIKDWIEIDVEKSNSDTIEIVRRDKERRTFENPIRTVKKYKDNLMDLFEKRRELMAKYQDQEKLRFPCEGIVILPNIDGNSLYGYEKSRIFPENQVVSGDAIGNTSNFIKVLKHIRWTWDLPIPLSDTIISVIKHTLLISNVYPNNSFRDSDSPLQKIGNLTNTQENIVFLPLPIRDGGYSADLVRGAVGSGKTIVLTKRADFLSELRPDLRILVTAFQLDLSNDLQRRISNKNIKVVSFYDLCEEILGQNWPSIDLYRGKPGPKAIKNWVNNFEDLIENEGLEPEYVSLEITRRKDLQIDEDDYKLDLQTRKERLTKNQIDVICTFFDWYKEYQENGDSKGHSLTDYEDIPELTLKHLFGHRLERFFDVIMIDEAQDFAPKWISVLKRLLKPGGYFFICDDPAQSLWKKFTWSQKGLIFRRDNNFSLERPQRTTKHIMDCAQCLFDIEEKLHTLYDIDIYPVKTDHLPEGKKPTVFQVKNREDELSLIKELLSKKIHDGIAGYDIGILNPLSDLSKELKNISIVIENKVYVGHFNLMKGLEFNTVIIPEVNICFNRRVNSTSQRLDIENMRKLFIAITRARKEVYMINIGDLPEMILPLLNYSILIKK